VDRNDDTKRDQISAVRATLLRAGATAGRIDSCISSPLDARTVADEVLVLARPAMPDYRRRPSGALIVSRARTQSSGRTTCGVQKDTPCEWLIETHGRTAKASRNASRERSLKRTIDAANASRIVSKRSLHITKTLKRYSRRAQPARCTLSCSGFRTDPTTRRRRARIAS
jgi:hypothetical protein